MREEPEGDGAETILDSPTRIDLRARLVFKAIATTVNVSVLVAKMLA